MFAVVLVYLTWDYSPKFTGIIRLNVNQFTVCCDDNTENAVVFSSGFSHAVAHFNKFYVKCDNIVKCCRNKFTEMRDESFVTNTHILSISDDYVDYPLVVIHNVDDIIGQVFAC